MLRRLKTAAVLAATAIALSMASAGANAQYDPYQQCVLDWRPYCANECTANGIPPGGGGHLMCREACVARICGDG